MLTTEFSTGKIYLRDTNIANNKSDAFVTKNVEIYDEFGMLVGDTDNDILDITSLKKGNYTIKIYYAFNILPSYIALMEKLEDQY